MCTATGLCLEYVGCTLRERVAALKGQAVAVQAAVEQSQRFWCAMPVLDGLPAGRHRPLSSEVRWRSRAHCGHQGRICLREPPWQPKSANAAVAAPGRTTARCAALSSASSASSSDSSSASSRERASRGLRGEMSRLHVLARAAFQMRTPAGGRGPIVAVLCGLRQQFRLGCSCLGRSPAICSFQAVLLRLVHMPL